MQHYVYRGHVFTVREMIDTCQSMIAIDLEYNCLSPYESVHDAIVDAEKYKPKKGMLKRALKQKNPTVLTTIKTKHTIFYVHSVVGYKDWRTKGIGLLTKTAKQAVRESKKIIDQICEVEEAIRSNAMHRKIRTFYNVENNEIPF